MDQPAPRKRGAPTDADTAIARKLFIAGCFLLPWLWLANLIFYRKAFNDKDAPRLLRTCG